MTAPPNPPQFSVAGQALLHAIAAEDGLEGSLVAVRSLRTFLKSSNAVHASQVRALWFKEGEALEHGIWSLADAGNTALAAPVSGNSASNIYRTFAAPVASTLKRSADERVSAAMGAIAAMSASTHQTIGAEICHAYRTLQASGSSRANRHKDWSKVVVEFPIDAESAQAWAEKTTETGLQRFLLALARALSAQLLAPTAIGGPPRKSQAPTVAPAQQVESADQEVPAEVNRERNAEPPLPAKDNLIGWLRTRADQAGYLSRWGAEGHWYKQSILELTEICGAMRIALAPGHPDRRFAFLACVTLATSISAKVALAIETSPRPDLWLDVAAGRCRMYLLRLLDPDVAEVTPPDKLDPMGLVDMWLPAAAWIAGQDLVREQPDATCVAELLLQDTSEISIEEFLTKHRAWIQSIGPKSLHGAKEARVARSMGSIHRMLCGDVTAALLAGDFDEVAMGTLHYITLPRAFLHQQSDRAWQLVGLGPAAPFHEPDGVVGNGKGLTPESLGAGLHLADQRAGASLHILQTTNDPRAFVAAWIELVHLRLLLTVTLSAGRGDHLERLTWAAVMGHTLFLILADKDVNEYSKSRLVPITQFLRATLDEHARDLHEACTRAPSLGLEIDLADAHRFGRREPGHLCFFGATITLHEGSHKLQEIPIDRAYLLELCQEIFGGELNGGRHTLISLCVQQGVEPPLIKALGGHQRGMAEVFSDGQWVAPADGLGLLAHALEWILEPLCPRTSSEAESGVLKLSEWKVRPPLKQCEESISQGPYPRVLSIPFHEHSLMSIRLVDQVRFLLGRGKGPDHAGARVLANYLAIAWISLPDTARIWQMGEPPTAITDRSIAAVWSRADCRASIRRPLVGPAAGAEHAYWKLEIRPSWMDTTLALANWLRVAFGQFSWASEPEQVMQQFSCCVESWLRMFVPPFLLAAASTRLSAPTASLASLNRLVAPPREQGEFSEEQLVRLKPQTRGTSRTRLQVSPLSAAMSTVHKAADPAKTEGENWARMSTMREELLLLDTTDHLPAETFVDWATEEARKWKRSEGGRIKVRSLNTYTSHLTPGLATLRPDDDMRLWSDEWADFEAVCIATAQGDSDRETRAMRRRRKVAVRRFMRTLAELGYNIPAKLLHADAPRGHDGMRKSAATCLLLMQDRHRITSLVVGHYSDSPLKSRQSLLYCRMRHSFSMRSAEAAVAPLNAITPNGELVTFPDGFAILKGPNAKRFGPIDPEVAEDFRDTAVVVSRARPGAKWVFLQDDRTDWQFINELEGAYAAAVKQVTGERDARPHSSRAITPLAALFPDWEGFIRQFLNGEATTQECADFCQLIRKQGFNALVVQLIRVGHGHPNTFIQYYFAIWDLLLSIYSQASLLRLDLDVSGLANATGSTCAAAFRQAARRAKAAGTPLDQWMWMTTYRPDSATVTAPPPSGLPTELLPLRRKSVCTASQLLAGSTNAAAESNQVMYLALRLTRLDEITAADAANITTSAARNLEQLIGPGAIGSFGARQQFRSEKTGGTKAELKYLRSEDGWVLARQLLKAPVPLVQQLAEALTPRRASSYVLPTVLEIRRSLIQFASHLPSSLGVLIQFGSGQLTDTEIKQIEDASMRVFVGDCDPDLGPRPRLFIVPTVKPKGLVARPRRTANTRAILAGIQLSRNHFTE